MLPKPPTHQQHPPLVQQWLTRVFTNKWAEVIVKNPGQHWISPQRPWKLEAIAKVACEGNQIVGIRPEGMVRAVITDFDHKPGRSISPYWEASGQSPELIALQQEAERCGLQLTMLVSSDSGGLHGVLSLPEGIKAWLAHWVGVVLLERSGMRERSGHAEVFPSEMEYRKGERNQWARSNGVRLPGQKGCKLIAGNNFADDSDLIYEQLISDLENTEICEAWEKLVEEAKLRAKKSSYAGNVKAATKKINVKIKWTGKGQSQENMARIAYWARKANPTIADERQLAEIIRRAAINAEGFDQFASEDTKKDVMRKNGGWAQRWARSILRRTFSDTTCKVSGDKNHNDDLFKKSRAALTRAWRSCKEAATWSKNKVAEISGLNRKTVQKHWDYWVQLAFSSSDHPPVHTPLVTGGPPEGAQGSAAGAPVSVVRETCGSHATGDREHEKQGTTGRKERERREERYVFVDDVGIFVEFLSRDKITKSPAQPLPASRAPIPRHYVQSQADCATLHLSSRVSLVHNGFVLHLASSEHFTQGL